ncbi:DUF4260 family protein [Edaphobacter aggregans]|uniref:DUF4260 family protein n=1 Tax=Edaphobacter aggregans TaxID=570835 RepID=UPI0009FBE30E
MLIRPDLLLRLEALLVLLIALICYSGLHGSSLLFLVLFLVPDVSLLGYLAEGHGRFAATFYNALHCYAVPLGVALIAFRLHSVVTGRITVIWVAHIALDRFIGFGFEVRAGSQPDAHAISPLLSASMNLPSPIRAVGSVWDQAVRLCISVGRE